MNSKAEQAERLSPADLGKMVLAGAVLAATFYAYYYFDSVAGSLRFIGVLVGLAVALGIAAFTAPGARAREYIKESQFEMRKVVWPTREETVRTTIVVLIVVVIISALLGLIDLILKWAILDTLLKMG